MHSSESGLPEKRDKKNRHDGRSGIADKTQQGAFWRFESLLADP